MRKLFGVKRNLLIMTDISAGGMGRHTYAAEVVGTQDAGFVCHIKPLYRRTGEWSDYAW